MLTPAQARRLRRSPEFKALEQVYAALSPLDPEGRRKVIEAIHALLRISEGRQAGKAREQRRSAR